MNKIFKSVLSVVLTVAMLFTVALPTFAASKNDYDNTPVVLIPGIINTPLINADGTSVLLPDFTKFGSEDYQSILTTLKSILKLQDTKNYEAATQKLLALLHSMLDESMCNADGTSKNNLHIEKNLNSYETDSVINDNMGKAIGKEIGMKNVYIFTYDWRMDTVDIVDNSLNQFIDMVKQKTGSDKVVIVGTSMGGAVTNTYLARYGSKNDVKKAIFISSAGKGVQVVNDILNKDIKVIREAFAPYTTAFADTGIAIGVSALSNYLSQILVGMLDSQLDTIWNDFLSQFFLRFPAIWEFAKYDESVEKAMADNNINPVLKEKVERYYKIQQNIDNTLTELQKKGVEICYVSNYNRVGIPVTSKAMVSNTDFLIDAAHTSNGATVSNLFTTLGDNYKQKKDDGHNHLSADGMIDASTCYTPEKTWFVKNLMHVDFGETAPQSKFIAWLIMNDNCDITTSPDYPQFMEYNKSAQTLTPVEKVTIDEADKDSDGYISSTVTTYTYTKLTALGWALIALIAAAVIILIAKNSGNKEKIDGVLTKKEIKALPKEERKPSKKNNKALKKQYKKDKKAAQKAHKAELKAMPKAERKEAKKADKAKAKLDKTQRKADKKASKAEKKQAKKSKKSEKKTAKV